jgi:hypothetical protein
VGNLPMDGVMQARSHGLARRRPGRLPHSSRWLDGRATIVFIVTIGVPMSLAVPGGLPNDRDALTGGRKWASCISRPSSSQPGELGVATNRS